ncbi:hypothetical protein VTO58DRAFT_100783 [Aureobasidium pullulans]|nr:hypothetical protein JADG_007117 [Aureobasidium pullulans]THX51099.1 hypothetical protein D6D06_07564 [Aureobasidium pullulans]
MPRNLKIIWLRNLYSSQIWQKPPIEQLIHNHAPYWASKAEVRAGWHQSSDHIRHVTVDYIAAGWNETVHIYY